jgi:vacuolar-type H+-ATPase subunit I/STV1
MAYINNTVNTDTQHSTTVCYYCNKTGHCAAICKRKLINRLKGYTGKHEEKFWETTKKLKKVPSGNLKPLLEGVERNIGNYDLKYGKHKFLVLLEKYAKRLGSSTKCLKEIATEIDKIEREIVEEAWHQPISKDKMLYAEKIIDGMAIEEEKKKKREKELEEMKNPQKNTKKKKKTEPEVHIEANSGKREKIQKKIDEAKKTQKEEQQKVDDKLNEQAKLLEKKKELEEKITRLSKDSVSEILHKDIILKTQNDLKKVVDKILNVNFNTKPLKIAKEQKIQSLIEMKEHNKQVIEKMKDPKVECVINGIAKLERADNKRENLHIAHNLKKKTLNI